VSASRTKPGSGFHHSTSPFSAYCAASFTEPKQRTAPVTCPQTCDVEANYFIVHMYYNRSAIGIQLVGTVIWVGCTVTVYSQI